MSGSVNDDASNATAWPVATDAGDAVSAPDGGTFLPAPYTFSALTSTASRPEQPSQSSWGESSVRRTRRTSFPASPTGASRFTSPACAGANSPAAYGRNVVPSEETSSV